MASKNNMKKLGVLAVIAMILVCLAAVAVAVISLLSGDGKNPVEDFLNGVSIEQQKDERLVWQTTATEGDVTAVIETSLGKIKFKLDGSDAAERFAAGAADFGRAEFKTAVENMFIQAGAVSGTAADYKEGGLGCFYGAVGFAAEDGKVYDSLVIITAKELSGLSKAYISTGGMKQERADFYNSFGGVPEYEGKVLIFGQVTEGFDVLEKIAAAENSGYTGGYAIKEPVKILSVSINYPKTEGQLE